MRKGIFYRGAPLFVLVLFVGVTACSSKPQPGPDKQGAGMLSGAAVGAGTGAITGFQISAGTGPGAVVGAGLGAVAGGIKGLATDLEEETMLEIAARAQEQRRKAFTHQTLLEHYQRRMELHPTRDIYPADLFFFGDETKLRQGAKDLLAEIAHLNKERLPWSRLTVAVYVLSDDEHSAYAKRLAEKRSLAISAMLVRSGLEPRRLQAKGVVVDAPVLIDPDDDPRRYSQAVELIPVDR